MTDVSFHPKREHLITDRLVRTGTSAHHNPRREFATGGLPKVESLWKKLNRRKVVQWGIAYIAGAWGFLQGLEYVSETFGWHSQLQQVCAMTLLVGLPMVLVLSWYHGDRGHQHVTGSELTMLTILFLIGGGLFYRFDWNSAETIPASTPVHEAIVTGPTTVSEMPTEYAVLVAENASLKMRLDRAENQLAESSQSLVQPILSARAGGCTATDERGRPLRATGGFENVSSP